MATTILALIAGFMKVLPEIVSLIKDIRAEHKQRDIQLQDLTAKQRYEVKQQSTANTIRLAVSTARDRVQGNTTTARLNNIQTTEQQ